MSWLGMLLGIPMAAARFFGIQDFESTLLCLQVDFDHERI